ncbi:DUF455 family protein [Paenibacillus sp. GCM10012303]|uniref:DUF455 family protein n=1 Tax=Paenibacillus sp. GCM10012303 TaxID=3317340 RepID=UPI003610FED5
MSANRKELRRIPQAAHLRRIVSFQRGMIGTMGAWIARLRHAEVKYMAARQLWEWAEHVDVIRKRLGEMPGGKPDAPLEDHLEQVLEEALFATDELPFLSALYEAILPAVRGAYLEYINRTAELPDRPSVHILEDVVHALGKQIETGRVMVRQLAAEADLFTAGEWTAHICGLLEHAGGLSGEAAASAVDVAAKRRFAGCRYESPVMQHRAKGASFSYDHPIEGYVWSHTLKGDPLLERVALAVWLYNEMDAAEYISPILYEVKGMPWEFYYDVARHTWDEARHSEFGCRLLGAFGFTPVEFEVWVATYMSSIAMKPHERYAAVTCWYEPGSFQVKPDYMERLAQQAGLDDMTVELLRFDLADETLHVSFGHKWVEKLMRHYGDERPVGELVDEVKKKGTALREAQGAVFRRTMPPEKRHTMETIRQRLESRSAHHPEFQDN